MICFCHYRFVRFVSSPEVLERFVTIQTEIEQIESSVQSNELLNGDAEGMLGAIFSVQCYIMD